MITPPLLLHYLCNAAASLFTSSVYLVLVHSYLQRPCSDADECRNTSPITVCMSSESELQIQNLEVRSTSLQCVIILLEEGLSQRLGRWYESK